MVCPFAFLLGTEVANNNEATVPNFTSVNLDSKTPTRRHVMCQSTPSHYTDNVWARHNYHANLQSFGVIVTANFDLQWSQGCLSPCRVRLACTRSRVQSRVVSEPNTKKMVLTTSLFWQACVSDRVWQCSSIVSNAG